MIPLFRPSCTDLEVAYVTDALRSGWWGMGPRTQQFEQRFARYAGAAHGIALNSCSAALQLALEGLGINGGEVILPALTFISTGLAALRNNCRAVFADVDPVTLCIDWADAEAKVTSATVAVIPVWYAGRVVPPPESFTALGIPVIEDCAHAAGSAGAGTHGTACWSFHAVKNLATGDGGMITTDDRGLDRRLRALRWCGIDRSTWERDQSRYGWEYDITGLGHKAHMNDLSAALGLAQLERLDDLGKARRTLVHRYREALADLDWLSLPPPDENSSWHLLAARVDAGLRDQFIDHLLASGVSAGVHYKPLSLYPVFGEPQPLPVTDQAWKTLVTLPLFPDMTDGEQAQVTAAVRSFTGRAK